MKLSNIKHLILTTILCALTVFTAKAQSCPKTNSIVGIEADAPRVVYTLHGDMTGVTVPHATNKVFTSDAVNEVFTNSNGTSVVAGAAYDAETTYYSASKNWNLLFDGGAPVANTGYASNVVVNSTWNTTALSNKKVYPITVADAKNVWDNSKLSSVYLYPAYKDYNSTGGWNATPGHYLYKINIQDWGTHTFTIGEAVANGSTDYIGENLSINGTDYMYMIESSKEIIDKSVVYDPNGKLPSTLKLIAKSEKATYYLTYIPMVVNGARIISGDYPGNGSTFNYDGDLNNYVYYLVSNKVLSNGEKVRKEDVTLLTQSQLDNYWRSVRQLTIGEILDGSSAYSAPATFTYNTTEYVKYITSESELTNGQVLNVEDFSGQSLLTPTQFNEFVNVDVTYDCVSDKLYVSTDGGATKTKLENGKSYTYHAGEVFWTYDATYPVIADNASFFTTNASYLTAQPVPVAESIVADALANGYTEVVFKSCDCGTAVIDNAFTQQLMNSTKIRVLNLAGVGIQQIVSPYTSSDMDAVNPNGTFVCAGNLYGSNTSIETLYTPIVIGSTTEEKSLLWGTFSKMPKLRYLYLSEGIETLGNKSVMGREYHLSTITFPNSLKYIKNAAVSGHGSTKTAQGNSVPLYDLDNKEIEYIQTLTFPAGLLEIESGAFGGTCPKDVYFLGVEAPRVGLHAWGDDAYISNNALTPAAATIGTAGAQVEVNLDKGRACRYNYTAQSGWIAMLHYPAECTKAQAAKYTDVTRDYRRIVYNTYSESKGVDPDDPTMSYSDNCTHYIPGKETTPLVGKALATSGAATNDFTNLYPWPEEDLHVGNAYSRSEWPEGYYGGNYSGGYYDYTVGDQYLWPSMGMAYRATVVAQNDVLWDGVTTIGEGIRDAGNESFVGDGSEYIGLHQFVFAAADVKGTSTTEWELEKYADGIWHTICLPFNMTKKQMKETFGAAGRNPETNELIYNIKLCKFNNVKRNDQLIQLYFTDEQFNNGKFDEDDVVLQAHVSYMIKAEKDRAINSVVFHNFIMEPGSPIPTQLSCDPESTRPTSGKYRFIGNYTKYATSTNAVPTTIKIPQYSYFFSGTYHKFRFQTGNNGIWSPYSSVVYTPEGAGEDDFKTYFNGISTTMLLAKVSTFYEIEDTPTEVMAIVAGDNELVYTNANIYTIGGQLVGNSVNGLRPGIYVVNGKKFFVR